MVDYLKKLPSIIRISLNYFHLRSNSGVAALLTVVIISVAVLVMGLSASSLGLGELEFGYTSQKGSEAFAIADGCMEETLRRIKLDSNYGVGVGTINLTLSNGSCMIDVVAGGSNRTITVTGTTDTYNKKIEANITLSGNAITVNSWEELTN